MPYYETVFIARQELTEPQVKELTDNVSKIITDQKGKIHKTEHWGLRTLAYKINKNRKGHYVLLEMECEGAAIIEAERQMRLNEDVLRYLTIREDELSDGPSVQMRKSDEQDNDRGDRGDRKPYNRKDKEEAA